MNVGLSVASPTLSVTPPLSESFTRYKLVQYSLKLTTCDVYFHVQNSSTKNQFKRLSIRQCNPFFSYYKL